MRESVTYFLPIERASLEEVQRQSRLIQENELAGCFGDSIPALLAVINRQRQIVYANRCLANFLKVDSVDALYGLRPGEALGCIHAYNTSCGCGTTEFCRTCGAAHAIIAGQSGRMDVQECRITRQNAEALDLKVWTNPVSLNGDSLLFFSALDISNEKRRQTLERIFFHDMLNTAGGLLGLTTILRHTPEEHSEDLKKKVSDLSQEIIDEIHMQRDLVAAENHELTVHLQDIETLDILWEIKERFQCQDLAYRRSLRINASQNIHFTSDPLLLKRILSNMVKNALEASREDDVITLGSLQIGQQVHFWVHNPQIIPQDVRLQVFQRSFSTKGQGRGLGTYAIRLIGEHYLKGQVSFTSTPEEGTIFSIFLPLNS